MGGLLIVIPRGIVFRLTSSGISVFHWTFPILLLQGAADGFKPLASLGRAFFEQL